MYLHWYQQWLERAVNGAPWQIPTLKFWPASTHKSHPWGMTLATDSICFLYFICENTHKVWYKNLWNWHGNGNASKIFILWSNWWPWVEVDRSNIIKFRLPCHILWFLYQTLCVFFRAATFTHVNGTVSCFCNKRLQNWPTVYTNFTTCPASWFVKSIF